ncbi:MAG: MFS transporter [Cyanobacteria bacterium SZAS-4]|nr:MFS transporter [Cyanobacteria bacterium SZAS-4]
MTDSSPYASLKIADFRALLAGRLLGTIALQIQSMAVGWQVYALTKDPLALGLVGLSEALPSIGVALYAGHVADRVDRRKIALWCLFTLVLCVGALSGCSAAIKDNSLLAGLIYLIIALSGFARGFYGPAVFGLTGDIVPREHYANAAAWGSAAWQASAVAGPIVGGILFLWLAAPATYLVSTLLLFGAFLLFLRVKARMKVEEKKEASVVENIKEGLQFVFSNQIILAAMAMDLFAVLFGGAVALLPIFTDEIFHMGPQALGILRAAPSVGALLVAAYLAHKPITKDAGYIFLYSVAGFGLCMIGFGLTQNFYIALVLLAVSGMLDGISVYLRGTIYQLLTPDDMKGRVSAVNNIFIGSSNEIGEFESGVAAKLLGLVRSVVVGGSLTLLVVIITAIKAPKLRKLDMRTLYREPAKSPTV